MQKQRRSRKRKQPMSKVTSLSDRRRKQNALTRRAGEDTETRLRSLEEDQLRLIELSLDLEQRLDQQSKYLRRLLTLVKKAVNPVDEPVSQLRTDQ